METEVLVIGSGPGGYVTAIRLAQLGKKVTIVESTYIGGVCLNVGCIPSKALITAGHRFKEANNSTFLGIQTEQVTLNFKQTQKWKDEQVVHPLTSGIEALLKKNKVKIIHGRATFLTKSSVEITTKTEKKILLFQQAIIAAGSRPVEITGLPFGERILDSTGGLNQTKVPHRLVIIGGGYIGCELAGAYANLGAHVTVLEGSAHILSNFEADIRELVIKQFKKNGVRVQTSTIVRESKEQGNTVQITAEVNGQTEKITADYVLVTVGRKPNTDRLGLENIGVDLHKNGWVKVNEAYQSSCPSIYAIGDVIEGPALAHKASYEGKVVAEVIAGKKVKKDYRGLPAICFTDPEIAVVGLTKNEAEIQGMIVETAMFPFQANGRALSLNQQTGFARIVFDKKTKEVVGAQIVGVNASDMIAEMTMAIENYLTLEDIALIIHGHPTLSEVIMDVSEVGLGVPIHL